MCICNKNALSSESGTELHLEFAHAQKALPDGAIRYSKPRG